MIEYTGILHSSLIVANVEKALDFYCDVLQLQQDPDRPELGYPGAWINIGPQQIHLLQVPNPDPIEGRPNHGGRDRHTAFGLAKLDQLIAQLEEANIPYTLSKSGRRALFCRDPDGNALEFIELPA